MPKKKKKVVKNIESKLKQHQTNYLYLFIVFMTFTVGAYALSSFAVTIDTGKVLEEDSVDEPLPREKKAFAMINSERKERGLSPLLFNPKLYNCAKEAARDIAEEGAISHNYDYFKPKCAISPLTLTGRGENVGSTGDQTDIAVESVVLAWMKSCTHRKNVIWNKPTDGAVASVRVGERFIWVYVAAIYDYTEAVNPVSYHYCGDHKPGNYELDITGVGDNLTDIGSAILIGSNPIKKKWYRTKDNTSCSVGSTACRNVQPGKTNVLLIDRSDTSPAFAATNIDVKEGKNYQVDAWYIPNTLNEPGLQTLIIRFLDGNELITERRIPAIAQDPNTGESWSGLLVRLRSGALVAPLGATKMQIIFHSDKEIKSDYIWRFFAVDKLRSADTEPDYDPDPTNTVSSLGKSICDGPCVDVE